MLETECFERQQSETPEQLACKRLEKAQGFFSAHGMEAHALALIDIAESQQVAHEVLHTFQAVIDIFDT